MRPLRILTWHVHGNYLYYLTHAPHQFFLPTAPGRAGFGGRGESFPFGDNVHDVPAAAVQDLDFDLILFQSRTNWEVDQYDVLSTAQRRLPCIYLEHDPPREHPTDTRHPVDRDDMLLVHVTHFNRLMWDSGRTPTRVVEHGVTVPDDVRATGELARGIVVVNNMATRGRRLGADVFRSIRETVPLDLVGMNADAIGGIGEVAPMGLAAFEARYRFFFNPIRYTSLGLAVCEAMMLGLPIVGLATTEMVTVVENGVSGYLHTDPDRLIAVMRDLIADPAEARRLGEGARRTALERFTIDRFVRDWDTAFAEAIAARTTADVGRGAAA